MEINCHWTTVMWGRRSERRMKNVILVSFSFQKTLWTPKVPRLSSCCSKMYSVGSVKENAFYFCSRKHRAKPPSLTQYGRADPSLGPYKYATARIRIIRTKHNIINLLANTGRLTQHLSHCETLASVRVFRLFHILKYCIPRRAILLYNCITR